MYEVEAKIIKKRLNIAAGVEEATMGWMGCKVQLHPLDTLRMKDRRKNVMFWPGIPPPNMG